MVLEEETEAKVLLRKARAKRRVSLLLSVI